MLQHEKTAGREMKEAQPPETSSAMERFASGSGGGAAEVAGGHGEFSSE